MKTKVQASALAAAVFGLSVAVQAHEGYTRPWKATSAAQVDGWSEDMFSATEGGVQGSVTAGQTYYVAKGIDYVTVEIPAVAGATAALYAFAVDGGWAEVASEEVPSNAMVRAVWTAEAGKALTGAGAKNVYQWQAAFVADKAVQAAPAPVVGAAGQSEVVIDLDTRTDKSYFRAADILPVWFASASEVKAQGPGGAETIVSLAANAGTVAWKPAANGAYAMTQTGYEGTTITLSDPVEVTTNGLGIAKASVAVTDNSGVPIAAQAEGEFAGKLIVPSNSTVRVVYTAAQPGLYFADGSTTQVATFKADESVNDALAKIAGQVPAAPAAPSVKVGVVAQRYPWDGNIDVQYKATNVPAGQYGLVVKVNVDGVVKGKVYGGVAPGVVGTVVYDLKASFGDVKAQKCRVTASLKKL